MLPEVVLLFQVSWQDLKSEVFVDLTQTEPVSFPANKICSIDHIGCINLIRLIYWGFLIFFLFMAPVESNFLMYLSGLDIVKSNVPEHSLKLAIVLLLSLSYFLVGLTVLKAIAEMSRALGLNLRG